jgi:toluene monooxygenase electron transfer component
MLDGHPGALESGYVRARGKAETFADFACSEGESILHAGLRAGVNLPYECASGTCGTCKAALVEGEIVCDWPQAPGHKTVKADRSEFLMCQTRAVGGVRLTVARSLAPTAPKRIAPRKFAGTIERYRRLSNDVVSIAIRLTSPINFAAGQFALFTVAGVAGARAYSMVNFREDAERIDLLVKRFAGGGFSTWLFDGDRSGADVRVFGPLGVAVFEPDLGLNLCLMAGGSGIAGMMAILEHANAVRYFAKATGDVFFGVRTGSDVFFLDELSAQVRSAGSNLRVTIALSHEEAAEELIERYPLLRFDTGFVHDAARAAATELTNAMHFIAGPPPMVDAALRLLLLDAKVPARNIRYDKFS